jgi:hypothetical protein
MLGDFGETWFASICTVAGLSISKPHPDRGVDFHVDGDVDSMRWQIKTTENPKLKMDDTFSVPITNRRLQKITSSTNAKSFIGLVVVRSPHPTWHGYIHGHRFGSTIVRACGYFVETTDMPQPSSDTGETTVSVPAANLLTATQLYWLF